MPEQQETIQLSTTIGELPFSVRTYNCLCRAKIETVEELIRVSPATLMNVSAFGTKCLRETASVLEGLLGSIDVCELTGMADEIRVWSKLFERPDQLPILVLQRQRKTAELLSTEAFDPRKTPLAQLPVDQVPLSTRAQNVLTQAHIRNLDGLVMANPRKLLSSTNCGMRTMTELSALAMDYLEAIPASAKVFYANTFSDWAAQFQRCDLRKMGKSRSEFKAERYVKGALLHSAEITLVEVFIEFLNTLDTRNQSIFIARMGLSPGHQRRTLEAVGREFDVTRERVRQIVDRQLNRFVKAVNIRRPDICTSLLAHVKKTGLATLEELVTETGNIGATEQYDPRRLVQMLLLAMPTEVQPLNQFKHLWSASHEINIDFYTRVLRTAKKALMGVPQELNQVTLEVARSLRQFDDGQIENVKKMLRSPSSILRVENGPNGEMVHPPHQNIVERRKTFLCESRLSKLGFEILKKKKAEHLIA